MTCLTQKLSNDLAMTKDTQQMQFMILSNGRECDVILLLSNILNRESANFKKYSV